MRKNKFKIIGMALLIMIISIGFSGCKSKYVKYANIDEIKYAEPTEYAKNFDIEGYISKLPEVEYKKIDYKIKETYTYKFNNYKMTIDIPEGFEVKEIPLKEKPKIVNSTSIEDSCIYTDGYANIQSMKQCGKNVLKFVPIVANKLLCIESSEVTKKEYKCNGILFSQIKSGYKGFSLRDSFIDLNIKTHRYNKKKNISGVPFLVVADKNEFDTYSAYNMTGLLNNNTQLSIGAISNDILQDIGKDLYFSIVNSVKIKKVHQ